MAKTSHEIRDPIHVFIRMDDLERKVIDSRPVQRLRQIHQLAMTYLVYPGATHRRFEHSLGVMELASRVFDIVTNPENIHSDIKDLLPELSRADSRAYWRRVVRMAALCHDLGHLPFSHAAEEALLPEGWDHERLTAELIGSAELQDMWSSMTPPLRVNDIVKLSLGQKHLPDQTFSDSEAILSEIIVGDAFGVDRMDYLLRDSLHAGVAYGRFDHFRLIDTLRILPPPLLETGQRPGIGNGNDQLREREDEVTEDGDIESRSREPQLGVESGGLIAAEALLWARYFMFSQVYFHPVRRIYDIHLKDFLTQWLPDGKFSTSVDEHLDMTDAEVTVAMARAARDLGLAGSDPATRIVQRRHFKVLWQHNYIDLKINHEAGAVIYQAASKRFGPDAVRRDPMSKPTGLTDFPVLQPDGRVTSALLSSEVLTKLPTLAFDYVFVKPEMIQKATKWLKQNRETILQQLPKEE